MKTSLYDQVNLRKVTRENWREVTKLQVNDNQKEWVADPAYYLCMCSYDKLWNPVAVCLDDSVIGFLMWALDDSDNSYWLGGIIIDKGHQGKGLGRAAIEKMIRELKETEKAASFALSYAPDNPASQLYKKIGFVESGEFEDDEIVARMKL